VTDLSTIRLGNSTDPYNHAAERGWDITDASQLTSSLELEADVVIVGVHLYRTTAERLAQADAMVAALASRGIRHLYVPFEGEQHGFRRAENIQAALEGELWFYGQILGFDVDSKPALPMTIHGAAGG